MVLARRSRLPVAIGPRTVTFASHATALAAVGDATSIGTVLDLLPVFALAAFALALTLPADQLRTRVPAAS
jgi:hypothetical protein